MNNHHHFLNLRTYSTKLFQYLSLMYSISYSQKSTFPLFKAHFRLPIQRLLLCQLCICIMFQFQSRSFFLSISPLQRAHLLVFISNDKFHTYTHHIQAEQRQLHLGANSFSGEHQSDNSGHIKTGYCLRNYDLKHKLDF